MAALGASRTESDRFERWLELIPQCNRAEEGIELAELADLFDDSTEAILGDVQALVDREYYLPGSFADSLTILIDGESLDLTSPDHFQRPLGFSPMEALALQLGLQLVKSEAGREEEQADIAAALTSLLELHAVPGDEAENEGMADSGLAFTSDFSAATWRTFEKLSEAVREQRVVELVYFKPYDCEEPKSRTLVPSALAEVYGNWYLLANDLGAQEPRMFRLDRVIDIVVTDRTCEPKEDLAVEDYVDPLTVYRESEDDLTVGICYGPRVAPWILEQYQEVERGEDGSVIVNHRCRSPWWVVTRALSYGTEARILDQGISRQLGRALESAVSSHV